MLEPLDAYLKAFDHFQGSVENLFETSVDLTGLKATAIDILTNHQLLAAFRYLAGPPLSADDLETLSEASLSRKQLENDPEMVQRVVEIVRMGLDRRRFPWVPENREPTERERAAAVLASAAMMAHSRVGTLRRIKGKRSRRRSWKIRC
ncbi:MAG: XamI family restriction endonuclease [Bryobacteraceae bacterium]